jgi:GDP-L-fucose synthase
MKEYKKIMITGGTGMVGQSFKNIKTHHNLIAVGRKDADLTNYKETMSLIYNYKPDWIVNLAAKVGGVKGNTNYISNFYEENIRINTNVLSAAANCNIKKVVSLLSTCVYPDNASYPLTEEQIHLGEPHASNFGYAYAKRMLDVHSRAIRKQYGLNYITAIPNNLYGPNDYFDLDKSHVIPAIIRKIYESKLKNSTPTFWGSGQALREFTFSEDVARALLLVLEEYNEETPINIGKTKEISIKSVVAKICKILGYDGKIYWDTNQPEGQYRKPSCNKKFMNICNNFEYTSLDNGLKLTCEWFVNNYPNIRGVR